ncbi:MAG: sulfurtransferase [Gammaproteobacteria bacterium]|nr:sulfurtransferase [Gammaproteobacteria bacterium]MDH5651723.1 sulfurtransferase [Gammaproteobacteria bacterium]
MTDYYSTIIDSNTLAGHLNRPDWRVIDCRFDLFKPSAGLAAYQAGHIPGALYANLNQDLSGPVTPTSGRHPLPDVEVFVQKLGEWGITPTTQVVVYDGQTGALAARLWWMLRWVGHRHVAVLDGGLQDWQSQTRPLETASCTYPATVYPAHIDDACRLSVDEVENGLANSGIVLIDARDPGRFAGTADEPLDKMAGHIPGSVNLPFMDNLDKNGKFKTADQLRRRFSQIVTQYPEKKSVHSCGSGVTACHNILAMEIAELDAGYLFPGSWSEWITDPARGVASEKET